MIHTKDKDAITRTEALMLAFGWQGGTIHQIVEETGCSAEDLIYGIAVPYDKYHAAGWFAYRTCSFEHNQSLKKEYKGNLQFWLGVANGVQSSIKQNMETPKKF